MSQKETNPLKGFFRTPEAYITLPSRGYFYPEGTLDIAEGTYELGILPMTGQDEVLLNNPDALLSGEAIASVIKSCVPSVNVVDRLLECDIEAIMLGIRIASYAEDASIKVYCPECAAENTYTINLDVVLNKAAILDKEYDVILDDSVTVYIRPSNFKGLIKQYQTLFEASKVERAITSESVTDEQRLTIVSNGMKKMSRMNFDMTLDSIEKVVFTNAEGELVEVTNRKHIVEYMLDVAGTEMQKITDMRRDIAKTGISKTAPVTCEKCEHKWEAGLDFNPMSFSSAS